MDKDRKGGILRKCTSRRMGVKRSQKVIGGMEANQESEGS